MRRDDQGSAAIEFVGLSVVLILPVIYLLLTVFQVQRAAFGVSQAAREAGRAYATAPSSAVGAQRAVEAATLAVHDQGRRRDADAGVLHSAVVAAGEPLHAADRPRGALAVRRWRWALPGRGACDRRRAQ